MSEFLMAGDNIAFVVALLIMLLIGIVEAVGLGAGAIGHDFHVDAEADWLSWLGVGRLPLLMLLVVFLAMFGAIGLVGQQIALDTAGRLLPAPIAVPAAALLALPLTGAAARVVALIMPRDETTAIDVDQLVGRRGAIVVGQARRGSPAKTRVRDLHGQAHYVMAEPDDPDAAFAEGTDILLVRREGAVFRAIAAETPPFSNWIER